MQPPRSPPLRTLASLSQDPLAALPSLQARFGDVYQLELPLLPTTVVVTAPEEIHRVLVRDFRDFRKDFLTRQLHPVLGGGLLLAEGDVWRRHRRMAQPAFHGKAIAAYGAEMVRLTEERLPAWGGRVDAHQEMMQLTLRIAAQTLFGHDIGEEGRVIGAALEVVMQVHRGIANTGLVLPPWIPSPSNVRYRAALRDIDRIVYQMIGAHRRSPDDQTLLGLLLAATDEGGGLTDQELRDEVVTLLMAGHETTAIGLTLALYLLSQHPQVEDRLHDELDQVLDSSPATTDLPRLPYTRAVVQEVLRLYPPAWSIGREPVRDLEIGGYEVRAGSHLWLAPWVTHRDARWFTDPLVFRPERWLDGSLERSLPDGAYLPFGLGPRTCIGKRFAELELVLVLATIARGFALRLAPGETLRLLPSITIRPEGGLAMIASPRVSRRVAA